MRLNAEVKIDQHGLVVGPHAVLSSCMQQLRFELTIWERLAASLWRPLINNIHSKKGTSNIKKGDSNEWHTSLLPTKSMIKKKGNYMAKRSKHDIIDFLWCMLQHYKVWDLLLYTPLSGLQERERLRTGR